MSDKLKPCPFCGSNDVTIYTDKEKSFWSECDECGMGLVGHTCDTQKDAVKSWNERTHK